MNRILSYGAEGPLPELLASHLDYPLFVMKLRSGKMPEQVIRLNSLKHLDLH